jgi:hypothetical protein
LWGGGEKVFFPFSPNHPINENIPKVGKLEGGSLGVRRAGHAGVRECLHV